VHPAEDYEATFASPEDVILKKLQFYAAGGSDRHLRDIAGVLRISSAEIDRDYVAEWTDRLGLREIWDQILDQA
jgi:hypothetical protein